MVGSARRLQATKASEVGNASTEVLRELLEIAELTEKRTCRRRRAKVVQKAVKEINEILAERAKKK